MLNEPQKVHGQFDSYTQWVFTNWVMPNLLMLVACGGVLLAVGIIAFNRNANGREREALLRRLLVVAGGWLATVAACVWAAPAVSWAHVPVLGTAAWVGGTSLVIAAFGWGILRYVSQSGRLGPNQAPISTP